MKRVVIIHRWEGAPKSDWYQSVRKELESAGFEVMIPEMPDTEVPVIEKWVNKISETITPDENTFFIGHSIGCQAILRYLETIDVKVGGAVFVAPWFRLDNLESEEVIQIADPWISTPMNFEKIRENLPKLKSFISSDEPYGFIMENTEKLQKELQSIVVLAPNQGHFTEDDGKNEFPDVVKAILEMSN